MMLKDIDVDRNAVVYAEARIDLTVSAEAVWAELVNVADWPNLMPGITSATLDGVLAPGSSIRWTVNGMQITSPLTTVEAPHRLVWRGTETAVHLWEITPTATGCTLLNAESLGHSFPGKTVNETRDLIASFLADWNRALGAKAARQPLS